MNLTTSDFCCVLFLSFIVRSNWCLDFDEYDPRSDVDLTIQMIIRKYGYPIEDHYVTTQDGYILHLHRIPHGRNGVKSHGKPVLLMHGLQASSESYIVLGPKSSLPYLLADSGYDVWLTNARGNIYSRNHTSLSPRSKKFWDFSFQEIGAIDLPDTIDYILNKNGHQKLYYMGHSQGGTVLFVLLSERPEYNDKLYLGVGFAANVINKHFTNPLLDSLIKSIYSLEKFLDKSHIYEMFPNNARIKEILRELCDIHSVFRQACLDLFLTFSNEDASAFDENVLDLALTSVLSGCSVKQVLHYGQMILAGEFQKYNFSKEQNLVKYHQDYPPKYNLTNVVAPIALYFSKNDVLVSQRDARLLRQKVKNVVHFEFIRDVTFGHIDFVLHKRVVELVYNPLMKLMEDFN